MNKLRFIFIVTTVLWIRTAAAQEQQQHVPGIAVFAPFYLDSAFDAAGTYRFGAQPVPRYIAPGIEFYEGVLLAMDSLDKEGISLKVKVFDTKRTGSSAYKLADSGALDSIDLILGAVSGSEYLDLAAIAKEKKIPFISATYPNDGGISENPYVVVVNSKLNTHLQAIYNYTLRNFGTDNLLMFRRAGSADDRVGGVFKALNNSPSGTVLNIRTVTLNAPFKADDIAKSLDRNRENIIICGSLDDTFARNLIANATALAVNYKITLIGMPTWGDFPEIGRIEVKDMPVIYSSTFFNPGDSDEWATGFTKKYARNTYVAPTELAFRGFELMYLFSHLLKEGGGDSLLSGLSEKKYQVLTDFDFKAIHKSKTSITPDYYENKRIYILRQMNGELTKMN